MRCKLTSEGIVMLAKLIPIKKSSIFTDKPNQKAGELFAQGLNCCQAVFQATTGCVDGEIMLMAKAFGGGIGERKCLCGAVTGGVMALGISGKGKRSGELVDRFRKEQGATCCAALSRNYKWKSHSHLKNCRRITEEAAAIVAELLEK
jgi:C_GCAxxG_C_C family probable redox protein